MSTKKDWKSKNPFATLTRNFGKQEKIDNLDDALQNVSRQLDQMEQACHDVGKKISGCLRTKGMEGDKRFQKLPEWVAGQTMISTSKLTPPLLGGVLGVCGQLYLDFAVQTVTSDEQQEQVSLIPLQNYERDLQNLHKTRKQFDKLTKDVESSKAKYLTLKQSKGEVAESKLNQCIQELDEAEQKLEQSRVQYSTELYSLLPREADLSNSLMQLMQAQAQYYRTCLELIDRATQEAQKKMQESEKGCVFGRGLEEHLKASGRDVAFVLEECIGFLLSHLDEEGLFRVAGGAGQVKLIKAALDAGSPLSTVDVRDVHCVSSLLKQYLRELPEPLLTFSLYDQWLQAMSLSADQRVQAVKATCDKLPAHCRDNLKYLLQFLVELSQHASRSKMTVMNIGVVIGPCLLWSPGSAADSSAGVAHANGLVEIMINSFDAIFPEGSSKSLSRLSVSGDKPTSGLTSDRSMSLSDMAEGGIRFTAISEEVTPLRPAPPPPTPSISASTSAAASAPPGKSIHSDMYSTAFALQTLGDGGSASSYLTKVQSVWSDHLKAKDTDIPAESMAADSAAKGHSRGSSAGSAAAFTAPPKSYTDVADWLTKSPQHAALDTTDDDGTSPRNTRKKKQAPMPPQLAPQPPTDVMTRSMDEGQSKSTALGRTLPPQRPDKPVRTVDKSTGPTSALSAVDKLPTTSPALSVGGERRAPRASMDEFDTSDCDMTRSTDTVGDTNGVVTAEDAERHVEALTDRLPPIADKPGKPRVPDRPLDANAARSKPQTGPPTVADALAAAGNEAMKKLASKPERPVDKPQVTETKTKPDRPDKPPQEHILPEQAPASEPKVKVPPVKPEKPHKYAKLPEKVESTEADTKKPDASPRLEVRSDSVPASSSNGDMPVDADLDKAKAKTLPAANKPQRPALPPLSQPASKEVVVPSLPSPDAESTHL